MKLMALSDTHLGHPGWGSFGIDVFDRAVEMARSNTVDVVLHCGDLVEPSNKDMSLGFGLYKLNQIPAKRHLWVAGNNDIEMVRHHCRMADYHKLLDEAANAYGVWLLDHDSAIIDGVGFAGNFGAYDTSLWRPPTTHTDNYPTDRVSMERNVREGVRAAGFDMDDFFRSCQTRLHSHIDFLASAKVRKCVVATHTVPTGDMLKYGSTPSYDFQNAWMGWDDAKSAKPITQTPNLAYHFCGHVHRHYQFDNVINVSGPNQPLLFDI
jgi:hypothetical protein